MTSLPPGHSESLQAVELIGSFVEWGIAALMLAVFALLIPLNRQRQVVVTWMIAWAAKLIAITPNAFDGLLYVLFHTFSPRWIAVLAAVSPSAESVFVAAIVLGTVGAVGRGPSAKTTFRILLAAAFLGALVARGFESRYLIVDANAIAVINIVALFGTAQWIVRQDLPDQRSGVGFITVALTLYGALSAVYVMGAFTLPRSRFYEAISVASLTSGYGSALSLAILSAAAIVLIVQGAFIEAQRANEQRISGVAASEQRLKAIIEAAQEAIITVDANGAIELANAAAEQLFVANRGALLGENVSTLIVGGWRPENLAGAAAVLPARGRRLNGLEFPAEYTSGPLRVANGSGAVIAIHDISERTAAQEERTAFEHKVAESEKMLAIGRVVSGVAHELNNPLAVVLGQSEQLVDAAPAGDVRSGLRLIFEQAQRARHIVKDLLAFVRHREEQREAIDVAGLVARVISTQSDVAANHGVTLIADALAALPAVVAERVAAEQVLINLIDNGLDAAGEGGSVRISGQVRDTMVELAVEDTGSGVPDDLSTRIFEPFYTTKGPGKGTGLGLSVSLAIAQQQGGDLRLESGTVRRGARFVFSLPISTTAPTDVERDTTMHPFPSPPLRADGRAAEVMLVDDEGSVRKTLRRLYTRSGWEVREAEDGNEALRWLTRVSPGDAPALILCDLKMPGLSGPGLYQALLAVRPELAARFVFVTGDVVEAMSSGFIEQSGRDVVEKPFTIAEIARATARTLSS